MSFLRRGYHKPMCPECAWGKIKHFSQAINEPKVVVYTCGTRTVSRGIETETTVGRQCRRYQREAVSS